MQFVEVIAERPGALQPHRIVEHFGGDEGIAVPIAANPRADPQEGGDRLLSRLAAHRVEPVLDQAVEARQLTEKRMVIVGEAVQHLVDDLELGLAQEIGAPEDEDRASQLLLIGGELSWIDGAVALVEQIGDLQFAQPRALPPDFGRMGGEHRAHQRVIEELGERFRLDAHLAGALKRIRERTGAGRGAGDRMGAVATDVMLIFGDVGEMREIAVGARDRERLVSVEAVERRLELAPRAYLVVAMEANRGLPDLLDQFENLFTLLLAHGVAEDSPEQTDVLAQRNVLLGSVRGAKGKFLDLGGAGHWAHPLRQRDFDAALRKILAQGRKIGRSVR